MNTVLRRLRKGPKPTRISEARRRELISAAVTVISEIGYNDVTVESICATAGFSRGLVGHYFSSKDELLLQAVRQVARELEDATRDAVDQAGADPLDRLHAIVTTSFTRPSFTSERVSVWVALAGMARWSPALTEVYRELWRGYRTAITRLMFRAVEETKSDVNVERAALTFSRLIEGFYIGWADDPATVSPEEAKAACHDYLHLLFGQRKATGGRAAR